MSDFKSTRRDFLAGAAAGAAVTATGVPLAAPPAATSWDESVDILIVGAGAAGASAAIKAHELGDQVLVIEKGPVLGGTAAKSVGGMWVPNNRFLREAGKTDPRDDALRYMVRLSYPEHYDPDHPRFGAPQAGFSQIATFFDHCARVMEELETLGVLKLTNQFGPEVFMPDYFAHLPENKAPLGRAILTVRPDGGVGNGAELMRQFQAAMTERRIPVRVRERAHRLVRDDSGGVLGLETLRGDGAHRRIQARKGVIFATGGFTHNRQMRLDFLKGPVFGGCAVPQSEGDFVSMATAAGAQLGNMSNAWWAQLVLEQAVQNSSVPTGIWCTPGDSMLQVNKFGRRFFNEKFVYNERTQAHFAWDPVRAEYPNLISLMIYDRRTADLFAGYAPIPAKGSKESYVIEGSTFAELTARIRERLDTLRKHTAGAALAEDFEGALASTVARFNGFAKAGKDADFGRGETPIEPFFHYFGANKPANPMPNVTLHPLADQGPYYAVLMAAGTLDTKGGPKINDQAQVLDTTGQPIAGLYGAGNCVASPTGPAYWAGGATLGPAITFGNIAAAHAHGRGG